MRPIENYNKELKKKANVYSTQLNNFIQKMNDLIEIQECFHNDMEKNQQNLFGKNNFDNPNEKIKISARITKKQTN